MSGGDWMSAGAAAEQLERQAKGWTVGTCRGRHGMRFTASRDGLPAGTCTVIGSYEEVRSVVLAGRRSTRAAS